MSKYNRTTKSKNVTTNHEGAKSYKMGDELELYTLVVTNALRDKFYESENDSLDRMKELIQSVDPEFSAKLAIYAREKMYLRSVPTVMAVELARIYTGQGWVSRLVERVIQRPDEITEMLAYYQYANNRTGTKKLNKLSNQIKLGIKRVFESGKFDEYQWSKYNRKQEIRLRDALFLTHPKPLDKSQEILFDKIANDTLDTAYTWETVLSDDNDKTKKEKWEEMINSRKMGYMAMLRNLRNFLEEGVSLDCMNKVCEFISDPDAVKRSKQLPFRFLAAYRMLTGNKIQRFGLYYNDTDQKKVSSPYLGMVLDALEKAIKYSIQNIPMFDNDTVLIATDVSGSMQQPVSKRSVITMYDIGTVLAMMMHYKCKASTAGMFGNTWKVVNFPHNDILRNADKIHKREGEVGYSTHFHKVLQWLNEQKTSYSKVMCFTDCQVYGGNCVSEWEEYKRKNPNAKLYLFDLQGYGTTPLSINRNDVFIIGGWSDKIFDILGMIENGGNTVDSIKNIEFDM